MSKAMLEEIKTEAEKAEKKEDETTEGVNAEKEKEKDVKKDRQGDRDWKRNGLHLFFVFAFLARVVRHG